MNYIYTIAALYAALAVFYYVPSDRRDLNFLDLAKYDGYIAEEHFVTTKDGYILRLFRIPKNKDCTENKGPIMFMHGFYLSGDDCLIPGPGYAHCYIYSDKCYDVWVPNARGNLYSRNHTIYDPDKNSDFWDFSIDEMALYDLPAVIDYTLNATNTTKLSYVGHSQGVSLLLILCTKIPEYNEKIKVGFGLSASVWFDNAKFIGTPIRAYLAKLFSSSGSTLHREFFPRNGIVNTAGKLFCGVSQLTYPLCSYFIFAMLGYNKYQITKEIFPVFAGHVPSGTSLKNYIRWGQLKNNGFSEYDYGSSENIRVYGSISPPLYNLSKVTMKWVIIASLNDYAADIVDVKLLVSKLPNVSLCVLSDNTFGHLDFVYGKDIPNYITPIVLSEVEKGTYKCT